MKRKLKISLNYYAAVLFIVLVISCTPKDAEVNSEIHIIPEPLEIKVVLILPDRK